LIEDIALPLGRQRKSAVSLQDRVDRQRSAKREGQRNQSMVLVETKR